MKPYVPIIAPKLLSAMSLVIGITNITLWPFIISVKPMSEGTERHERTHVWQQLEIGAVMALLSPLWLLVNPWLVLAHLIWCFFPYLGPFYVVYGAHWLWLRRWHDGEEAYRRIIFEREAYGHDEDPAYLASRRWFAWLRDEQP